MFSRRNTVYIASFRDKSKILNLGVCGGQIATPPPSFQILLQAELILPAAGGCSASDVQLPTLQNLPLLQRATLFKVIPFLGKSFLWIGWWAVYAPEAPQVVTEVSLVLHLSSASPSSRSYFCALLFKVISCTSYSVCFQKTQPMTGHFIDVRPR